jgi:thioredoxin-related protein
MRTIISLSLLFLLVSNLTGQNEDSQIYNPVTNANKQIQTAIDIAGGNNKHVLIQVGGNWCPWCIKLHNFIYDHNELDSLIKADFVYILVNYSKENKNMDVMARLGNPQRFGFPVLVILDDNGSRIHTQNTAYLEEEKTYNEKKIREFLLNWNSKAIDPSNYIER